MPLLGQPVVCPVLIGREQELSLLERSLKQALTGQGQVLLISGEAGVGKTRLLAEVQALARRLGLRVLQGRCFELDRELPLAPLLDLHSALSQPASLEPGLEKRSLFQKLAQDLFQQAQEEPLLVALEDLHWADEASLEFALYLARRSAQRRVALLFTYRSDEFSPALRHLLAGLDRERLGLEVRLNPLEPPQVEAMLWATLGQQHLPPEFSRSVATLTEGNPFLVEEVLKVLLEEGRLFHTPGGWVVRLPTEIAIPRSVQEVVQRHSASLDPVSKRVLELAAVAGRYFDFALLQSLTGLDEPELLQNLKKLIAAQLVVEESAERFAFRHALSQQAVYAGLLARERRQRHLEVGYCLERLRTERLSDLAHHFFQAGSWEKALDYGLKAAEQAQVLFAPHEALEQLRRARFAAEQLSASLPAVAWRIGGQAHQTLGEFEAAGADYLRALGQARAEGNASLEWQLLIDLGRLWTARDFARSGEYFHQALEKARRLGNPEALAYSLNRLGNWQANQDRPDQALALHREALALFERLGDVMGTAETLDLMGFAHTLLGQRFQGLACYRQAVEGYRKLNARPSLVTCMINLAEPEGVFPYYRTCSLRGASALRSLELTQEAYHLAGELEWSDGQALALANQSMFLLVLGEFAPALEAARTSLAMAERSGHQQWLQIAHAALGNLYLELGAPARALAHFEQSHSLEQASSAHYLRGFGVAFLALAHLELNQIERARERLRAYLNPKDQPRTAGQRLAAHAWGRLALAAGEGALALELADRLLSSSPDLQPGDPVPYLHQLRGEALMALRRYPEAKAALQAAHRAVRELGLRPLWLELEASLGRLYQAQRRRSQAEAHFAAAYDLAHELAEGIPDPSLQESFLRARLSPIPPLSPGQAPKKAFGGLTPRECQVAALVAQGMSNLEVAQHLGIGERTAETHVGNILNKLGFHSRIQIAAWAVQAGLVGTTQ